MPDQISFTLTVDRQAAGPRRGAGRVQRDHDAGSWPTLGEHGVEKADVQTTGLSMHPEYDYHAYDPPTLVGYRVTQRAQGAGRRARARAGRRSARPSRRAATACGSAGSGSASPTPTRCWSEARDAAVESATAKAEQYAAATGQSLGDVVSIREVGRPAQRLPAAVRVPARRATRPRTLAKALPIRAGKDDLEVRIQVVWASQFE